MTYEDRQFGVNPESEYGTLATYSEFDKNSQNYDEVAKKYIGKFPTLNGSNRGYYESLANPSIGITVGDGIIEPCRSHYVVGDHPVCRL